MKRVLLWVMLYGWAFADVATDYQAARELADGGKLEEAFLKFAAIPGGESSAVALARGEAAKFLTLLKKHADLLASPRGRLIEAELLLASGRRDEAVEKFKGLADVDDWGADYFYPVEAAGVRMSAYMPPRPAVPFFSGPGSHRDNWLLRRLIALDLMDEAGREFARVWKVHKERGVAGAGLQFALDYAFFLKRMKRDDEALEVLLEPLRVMDLDRGMELASLQGFHLENPPPGVSQKEYLRLAYGEFKQSGRVEKLVGELRRQIDGGENRARKVLAQVRLHEGDTAAAMALEMEFIAQGGFNPANTAYRRGVVLEANGMTTEAVEAFEQVLPAGLANGEVGVSEASPDSATIRILHGHQSTADVRERLKRLYAALGRMDKVMEMEFAQFEESESQLQNLHQLENLAVRLRAAGQEERFTEWSNGLLATAISPRSRANLAWVIGDYPAAVRHAAEAYQGHYHERDYWRANFAKADARHELEYLRAVVAARPEDARARLELLDLEGNVSGPEAIAALEALLELEADEAFPQHRRIISGPASFLGFFDLTYRLMRLYERHGQHDKLRALGLRVAKEEKPFADFDKHGYEGIGTNGREEYGNACLALAVQHAENPFDQKELAAALETSRWSGARAQLARRMAVADAGGATAAPPWANLPSGVRVVVSCESVACMAKDERYRYAGLPWGVAVYDMHGTPVTRILLGSVVTHLAAAGDQVWAGTETGVFLIEVGKWSVVHEPVGEVVALGLDGEQLWIGVRGHQDKSLMVLNRHTLEMRTFSAEEVGIDRTIDFTRFEPDGEYLWADNYFGLLRYERATGIWSKVENPGARVGVHLIAVVDGEVWADVWVNDELRHRPARVDRQSLKLTVLEMRGNAPRDSRMLNSDLQFFGHHHGQPVFGAEGSYGGQFVVEENSDTMRRLHDDEKMSDPLPNEIAALPKHAWPDGLREGVRSTRNSDLWPSDAVWAVVFDDARQQEWLCVGAGLAVMPRNGSAMKHFGSAEGLTRGPVLDGVELGGKLYFGSAWDDHRGALTRYDPQTRVFIPWFRSDGMDSNKVAGLGVRDGKLEVRYGVEYPGDDTKNDLAPGFFDPATGVFTPRGAGRIEPVEGKRLAPAVNGTLPVLGGDGYGSDVRNEKTWHCGARGLVIYPGRKAPVLAIARMPVRRVPSPVEVARAEALKVEIPEIIPTDMLRELLEHPNPYVRFRAVRSAYRPVRSEQAPEYTPILVDAVNDSHVLVRAIAVWNLSQCEDPSAWLPLREAMDETDPGIHAMAMVAMAKRGEMPQLEHFARVMKNSDRRSGFRYDETASFSVGADEEDVFTSLARHADREVFEFLVKQPPPNLHYVGPVYPEFGESLRKHPDAATVLLGVKDKDRHGPWRNFVQGVFQHAGTEMLPILHEALRGDDRVVCSNAARACGAIGDKSSIPHLLQALEMESGLVRASVVWALGELKAVEAIPRLIALHQSERNAEKNRRDGRGMLTLNTVDASQGAYVMLSNLDAIESDWDEMKASIIPHPPDPSLDEELLTPEHILEAMRSIWGPDMRGFQRALAASENQADRYHATLGLATTDEAGREENRAILRILLADADVKIRTSARVSLHALGGPELKDAWGKADPAELDELLRQMMRLPADLLEPMRGELEAVKDDDTIEKPTRNLAIHLLGEMDRGR
jgi:HEAT repeat protein